jgi:hypothetical protein
MASWLRLVAAGSVSGGGDARPVVAVADRLGVVSRIALSADAWDARPQRVMTIGHRVVRLNWFGASDAHTRLLGGTPPPVLADFSGDGGGPGHGPESTGRASRPTPRPLPGGSRGERSLNTSAAGRPTADESGN